MGRKTLPTLAFPLPSACLGNLGKALGPRLDEIAA